MRTFISVELPKDIQKAIGDYISNIRGLINNVKWVSPHNLHLTIKFLGEVKATELENLSECIEKSTSFFSPFVMGLSDIGFFPSRKKPKVIWIGADGGEHNLLDLFHELEHNLEDLGIDREARMFSPHLTIGRVKRYKKIIIPEDLPDFKPVNFQVQNLAFIKSILTPQGPIYEKLFEGGLKKLSV